MRRVVVCVVEKEFSVSEQYSQFSIWGFLKGFGKLVIGMLLLLQGVIGLVVLLMFVGIFVSIANGVSGSKKDQAVTIPEEAALVIDPNGVLVELAEAEDPFEAIIEDAYGASSPSQISVHDLVRAIRHAKDDDRIKGIVLKLDQFGASPSSASKLHYIAAELSAFKESGKKIYAVGDSYGQEQYLLAAQADEVLMHDFGAAPFIGYGRYGLYLKSFLDKLKITGHVFRVGTFKSAVEPFLGDEMSEAAKEANRAYLDVLWSEFLTSVETARGLETGSILDYSNNLGDRLREANGDFAQAAVNAGLVDKLGSREEHASFLKETFGKSEEDDDESYNRVDYKRYLSALTDEDNAEDKIAVITAAGTIVDGQAPLGEAAGGDTIAALLKRAREDEKVKAVVLRIDSPGGSAFASEVIRDEILAIKEADKPVVASMGSLAASGGYWIASPADEIWAAPTTITGSIGIFAFFTTFENLAADWGVHVDGVGTTPYSALAATGIGPLPENVADLFQQSIENGYDEFLNVVAEGRDLDKAYLDTIAQGRVWIGTDAQELKLVDKIGSYDDAITSAASLAGIEEYSVVDMIEQKSPFEEFLSELGVEALSKTGLGKTQTARRADIVREISSTARDQAEFFSEFNDPNAAYARCLTCETLGQR